MKKNEIYVIPFEDIFLIYRPLLHLAIPGNGAMALLAMNVSEHPHTIPGGAEKEAYEFLRRSGFLRPDPDPQALHALRQDRTAMPFQPSAAALLMTNRCSLRCIYCYANGGAEEALEMPSYLAEAAIDTVCANALAKKQQNFQVTFHGGGEPTLAWDVLTGAAAYARKKELPAELAMVSNGIWSRNQLDWITENLDGVTVSMDGGGKTQDAQRPFPDGRGSFSRVMESLAGLDRKSFPYGIRVTCMPERFADLAEDVRFLCRETNFRVIQIEPAFNLERGRHARTSAAQGAQFAQAFLEAADIVADFGRQIHYSGARPWLISDAFCEAPLGQSLTVNPKGEVVGCYECTGRLAEIEDPGVFGQWNGQEFVLDHEKRRRYMEMIQSRKDACSDCFCRWHCAGDCYTRGLPVHDGAWPYARCGMNRAITKGLIVRGICEQ